MKRDGLKLVFLGTPGFAVPSLKALHESAHEVLAVVTAPDRPAGRGLKPKPSAVKTYALEAGLPLLQPTNLKDPAFLDQVRALRPDLLVVVAFRMMPEILWNLPPLGSVNLHASYLPNYRGAAPINRVLMNGETETGCATFLLAKEIDTGPLLFREKVSIEPGETAGHLHDRLMVVGARLLLRTIDALATGTYEQVPQDTLEHEESLRVAPRIYKDDCMIDWKWPAAEVLNLVRGLSPYPGAIAGLRSPSGEVRQVKIGKADMGAGTDEKPGTVESADGKLRIACADRWLEVLELQLPGKRMMPAADLLRGMNLAGWQAA